MLTCRCHPSPRCSASQPHGNQKTCLGADKPSDYGPERLPEKLGVSFLIPFGTSCYHPCRTIQRNLEAKDTGLRD